MSADRSTKVLTFGIFLTMTGLTLVAPILPLYAREFGVSRTAAGALISSFALARLAFDVVGGIASDRLGAKRVMVGGALVIAVSSVGAALAPNYGVLLLTRVLEGIGSAAFATAAMQMIVVAAPAHRRGRTMAFFQTGLLAGVAIGPVLGGYAAELGDFATPFWLYAVLGLIAAALVWRQIDPAAVEVAPVGETFRAAGRLLVRVDFLALMFVALAIFIMRSGARFTLLPLYAGEDLGLGESQIGLVFAASALVTLLLVNPGGWLVDRVGRRPVLIAGLALTAVAIGAHGFATTFPALLLLSVGYGASGAFMGIPPPTLAGDLAPPGVEGASVGLYRMATDLGLVIGPVLMGWTAEEGSFRLGFLIGAAVLLAGAAVAALITEPRRAGDRDMVAP